MKYDTKNSSFGLIPHNWDEVKLGDVFEPIGNYSYTRANLKNEYDNECVFYIHYGDIHATYSKIILDFDKEKKIPVLKEDIVLSTAVEYLKNGDLVIADASEDYEGIGKCIELANIGNNKVIGGLHTIVLRDKCGKTVDGYRGYLLKNNIVSKELRRIATGTSVYGITKSNLSRINLLLPPLPEQQKIAEILTTVDDKLENIESQIAEYTSLKTGLMQQLLTKGIGHTKFVESELGMIPEGWKVTPLSNLTSLMTNGFVGTATTFYTDEEDGITYIQGYNVDEGKFRLNGIKKVSRDFHNKHLKSCLEVGDVLTIQTGDVGVSAVVSEELSGSNCHALIISRPIVDMLNSYFLAYFLNSQIGKTQIKSIQVGSTMLHINVSHFLKYKIPLPQLQEQEKIVEILSSVDEKIESLQHKKEEFTNLKKGLMEQLLTGRVRVKV